MTGNVTQDEKKKREGVLAVVHLSNRRRIIMIAFLMPGVRAMYVGRETKSTGV